MAAGEMLEAMAIERYAETELLADHVHEHEDHPEELPAMHVKHGKSEHWHRPTLDVSRDVNRFGELVVRANVHTACGERISSYYATRPESYEGLLCRGGCFTPFELAFAERLRKEADERRALEQEAREARYDEDFAERAAERARNRESARLDLEIATGKHAKIEAIADPDDPDPEDEP